MHSGHEFDEVKAYLLGTLDADRAAALEEQYFASSAALARVRGAETELIRAYLSGALSDAEKRRFEAKYLRTPALLRRVDEVRGVAARENRSRRASFFRLPGMSFAAAALGVALIFSVAHFSGRTSAPGRASAIREESPEVLVSLSPGVAKGGAREQLVAIPPAGLKLALSLELPGVSQPSNYRVRIERVGDDGRRVSVMADAAVRSTMTGGGSTVSVVVNRGAITPGDYLIHVLTSSGDVAEGYQMHAVAASR